MEGRDLFQQGASIVLAIIAVALVAVLVSNQAQTGNVLGAFGSAIANMLSAATAPVTGNAATPNVSGTNSGLLGGSSIGNIGSLEMPSIG